MDLSTWDALKRYFTCISSCKDAYNIHLIKFYFKFYVLTRLNTFNVLFQCEVSTTFQSPDWSSAINILLSFLLKVVY